MKEKERLDNMEKSLKELVTILRDHSTDNIICIQEEAGKELRKSQKEVIDKVEGIAQTQESFQKSQDRMFKMINDIEKKRDEETKRIDDLEKRLYEKEVNDKHEDDSRDRIEGDIKKLEDVVKKKATKEDKEGLEKKIDEVNDNMWKLIIALLGIGITLLVFFMGIILKGG